MIRALLIIASLFLSSGVQADTQVYPLSSPQQQQDFSYLTQNLRCLVCANQSLADSNAPLAADLRNDIYQQILAGKTREDILNYVVQRYGDYVLYQPPFQSNTWVLWLAPFILLLMVVVILLWVWRKNNRRKVHS